MTPPISQPGNDPPLTLGMFLGIAGLILGGMTFVVMLIALVVQLL